jgi:hypothetical protein
VPHGIKIVTVLFQLDPDVVQTFHQAIDDVFELDVAFDQNTDRSKSLSGSAIGWLQSNPFLRENKGSSFFTTCQK